MAAPAIINPRFRATDSSGNALVGGKLYTNQAGSTTVNKTTYSDTDLSTPNTNPIILDSYGECDLYFVGSARLRLFDSDDNLVWDRDDVVNTGDVSSEWINSLTATYASATTFTLSGDQTTEYHVNRRIRATDSSTLYGYISNSSYGAPNTTVTVVLDSGNLSASLTSVATSVLAANNTSVPVDLSLVQLDVDNIRIDGNTISSTNTDGNINLTPNGAGLVNIPNGDLALNGTAVTSTADELNILDGVTATTTELNILDGVTATTGELNTISGNISGSYTGTATGISGTPTSTIYYRVVGNIVHLRIDGGFTGTSDATSFTITGAPVAIRPDNGTGATMAHVVNNGSFEAGGSVAMGTNGTITVRRLGASNWTASGTKALDATAMSYFLTLP